MRICVLTLGIMSAAFPDQSHAGRPHEWTLEIVPAHVSKIADLRGLVNEIFVTMIPGSPIGEVQEAMAGVAEQGFVPIPHVSARNFRDEEEAEGFFGEVSRLGLQKALILAGGHGAPAGPFADTMSLLQTNAFAKSGLKTVAIAGHPEGNPEDPNCWDSLMRKWDWLRERGYDMEIVTQWSFAPDKVNRYLETLVERGVDAPVRVGVPGPATLKTLLKYAEICGVNAAATVIRKQGFSFGRLLVANKPDRFVADVQHTRYFHLYPFGGIKKCADWLAERIPVSAAS